ncbi:AraC family transcriptional regulator [Meiothermus granaticius]|uniref:Bacterial regulatory helix-turn-helix protein, AraC family n=1 Tax=Meiothermus granaticius NBRC 107808 TaxID=1227551 RepID=A0A399FBC0_9DEIN|nr:AraC family transcriptional regulator [Meiothermus granaticius]RIH93508.1 Bacterial regulatory helix-turn-helix protein, AraC family [Meiothermus granaticius NBRC 107808]
MGVSLTEAAHTAGFADSAHLSRVYRATFGLKPSPVFGNSRLVQVKLHSV